MSLKYPDILEHNNPNNPLMDVNQLEGVSIIDLLTERDIIPIAKRKGGHFVISKAKEKAYIYTGTTLNDIDWDNASNWTECGGSIDGTFISPTGVNINTVTPYIVTSAGDIGWNAVDGTFDMKLLSGVTLQAGQELYFYGKATEAISNGDCVQFAGVQGDHITLKKAVQSEIAVNPMLIIGVATQNISNNAFGYVTGFGKVNGVYTTGFSLGSLLYYDSASTVAGKVTSVVPVAPYRKVLLATVIKLQTGSDENGIILVRPTFGLKLTDLDDVDGNDTNIVDTDIIIKGDTTGIFKRVTWANVKTLLSNLFRLKTETGDAHGWVNAPNTGNFTVSNTGLSYTIGINSSAGDVKINGTDKVNNGFTTTFTASLGQSFLCVNSSGALLNTSFDILDKTKIPACILYTDGTRYRLSDELHDARRNLVEHKKQHDTDGARYVSGGATTFGSSANNTFSMASVTIRDEDRYHIIGARTQGQMMYRNVGNTLMTLDAPSTYFSKINGTNPQYDNNGVLTDLTISNYGITWMYATNAKLPANSEVVFVLGQGNYTSVALAQAAPQPNILGSTVAEWKLMYRIIYRRIANALVFTQADDFRLTTTGLVISGGAGLPTLPASQVSVVTVSGFTATEQQTFDEQVASRVVTLETNETPPTIGDTDNVRFKSGTGYFNRTLLAIKNYVKLGLKASEVVNDSNIVLSTTVKAAFDNADCVAVTSLQDTDMIPFGRENGAVSENKMIPAIDAKSYFAPSPVLFNVTTTSELVTILGAPTCPYTVTINLLQTVELPAILNTYALNILFVGRQVIVSRNVAVNGMRPGAGVISFDVILLITDRAIITVSCFDIQSSLDIRFKDVLSNWVDTQYNLKLAYGVDSMVSWGANNLISTKLSHDSCQPVIDNDYYVVTPYGVTFVSDETELYDALAAEKETMQICANDGITMSSISNVFAGNVWITGRKITISSGFSLLKSSSSRAVTRLVFDAAINLTGDSGDGTCIIAATSGVWHLTFRNLTSTNKIKILASGGAEVHITTRRLITVDAGSTGTYSLSSDPTLDIIDDDIIVNTNIVIGAAYAGPYTIANVPNNYIVDSIEIVDVTLTSFSLIPKFETSTDTYTEIANSQQRVTDKSIYIYNNKPIQTGIGLINNTKTLGVYVLNSYGETRRLVLSDFSGGWTNSTVNVKVVLKENK